jgi:hypothetical protein
MLGSAPHFDNAAAAEERHTTITMVWLPGFPVAVRSWYDPAMPARRGRDNTAMLWVEEGETRVGPVATVAPVAPIDKEYTFAIPDDLADRVQAGQRVVVPLGRAGRLMTAFCLRIELGQWSSSLKPIDSLVDQVSFLPGRLLELGRWMARHYACPLGRTLGALVPAAVHKRSGFRTVRHARLLVPLEQIADGQSRLGPRQRRLLEELSAAPAPLEVDDLLARSGVSAATLRQAVQRGWIEMATERVAAPAPDFDLPTGGLADDHSYDRRGPLPRGLALRSKRERQDRGLHTGDAPGPRSGAAGHPAGAGDRPDHPVAQPAGLPVHRCGCHPQRA